MEKSREFSLPNMKKLQFKIDSTKGPNSSFINEKKYFLEKLLTDQENLDIQHYMKNIDTIVIGNEKLETSDPYLINLYLMIVAIQGNHNPNKRDNFLKVLEKFRPNLNHEVRLLLIRFPAGIYSSLFYQVYLQKEIKILFKIFLINGLII